METKTQAVAVRTQMQEGLALISEKLKQLKSISETPYKTSGEFRFNPAYTGNPPIRIFNVIDLGVLIGVLGAIKGHYDKYEDAAEILGLKEYPVFEWCGFTYEAWAHDLKLRASIISEKETREKLLRAKSKLEQFLTEEDRLAITLQELKGIL